MCTFSLVLKILSNQSTDESTGMSHNKRSQHQIMQRAIERDCISFCKNFHFDRVFPEETTQEEVFASLEDNISAVINGENATVISYGASGSGKSFTLFGTGSNPGIAYRAMQKIFRQIENFSIYRDLNSGKFAMSQAASGEVSICLVELCNNTFRNLLQPFAIDDFSACENSSASANTLSEENVNSAEFSVLKNAESGGRVLIHENKSTGRMYLIQPPSSGSSFSPNSILRTPVHSSERAMELISKGLLNRSNSLSNSSSLSTNCIGISNGATLLSLSPASKSHLILTIYIERKVPKSAQESDANSLRWSSDSTSTSSTDCPQAQQPTPQQQETEVTRVGKLHLVELAGFERTYSQSISVTAEADGQHINRSLLALETVLYALSHNDAIKRSQQSSSDFASTKSSSSSSSSSMMHVPYLNSKLTHVLKDSLSKRTSLIINIRPEYSNHMESLYALRYANRIRLARATKRKGPSTYGEGSSPSMRRRRPLKSTINSSYVTSRKPFLNSTGPQQNSKKDIPFPVVVAPNTTLQTVKANSPKRDTPSSSSLVCGDSRMRRCFHKSEDRSNPNSFLHSIKVSADDLFGEDNSDANTCSTFSMSTRSTDGIMVRSTRYGAWR